jgi:Bacterial PH domain/Short C-terminal domain
VTTTEEIQQLAEQKLQNRFGVRKELKTLHELLHEGETVLNLGSGVYGGGQGLVVVTDQRVIFYARSLGRSRQEDFRFSRISSVQSETGMLGHGKLVLFAASGNKAVIHSIYPMERAGEVGDYVRSRLAANSSVAAAQGSGSAPTEADPAERLRRLRSMLDEGLISAEEYEEKRGAILGEL